jgi:nucleoside-diphosphate-sugar epimerase
MAILVTGANGLVGSALCAKLRQDAHSVRGAVRVQNPQANSCEFGVGNIDSRTNWRPALANVQHVVHCAARVHVMNESSPDPLSDFRRVNVEGTANLARQAAQAGVKRFVFLSSVKVNGEWTLPDQPFTADDNPAPQDAYGISKAEAEAVLRQIALETGMEVVIIRPPLVYGPGVKANFATMMRWLRKGVPLPLAAVNDNRRSLVALDNLLDLIVLCLHHPAAANQTFLVSDAEDLSTAQLLERMACALSRHARLFYVPRVLLKIAALCVNKLGVYQRLCSSLQLDISKTRQLLAWSPPVSVDMGLRRAAEGGSQ